MWEARRVSIAQDGNSTAGADIPAFRGDRVVSRTRLVDALDAALTTENGSARIALVCAPAGSGKTTLLSTWARRLRTRLHSPAIAWTTVGERDNTADTMHASLTRALANAGHSGLRQACLELSTPARMQPVPIVDALRGLDEPLWLIIDDAHLLHEPAALAELEAILRAPPEKLKIVVCGRFEPPLAFQQLRLEGRVFDLTFEELAFTGNEAAELLAEHTVRLSDPQLAALMERTEGWAAGLRLAGMSLAEHPDPGTLIANFTGDRRAVADYLIEQVLIGLDERERDFLLRTSVPNDFTVALAEQLTGRGDAHDVIDALEHRNFLVTRTDLSPKTFRYHPLLRSYLRAEISRLGHEAVADLEHVAAQWYAEFGNTLLSLEHGITAGDHDDVVAMLAESGLTLIQDGHGAAVERLLVDAPREVRKNPITRLIRAAGFLDAGNPRVAASILASLEDEWPPPDCARDRVTLLRESLRVQTASYVGDIAPALDRLCLVDMGNSGDADLDAFVLLQRGRGQLHLGRLADAEESLRTALIHARESRSPRTAAQARTTLAVLAVCSGRISEATELTAEVLPRALGSSTSESNRAVLVHALCRYLRNESADAADLAASVVTTETDPQSDLHQDASIALALYAIDNADDRRAAIAALHGRTTLRRPAPRPPGAIAAVFPSMLLVYLDIGETAWGRELLTAARSTLGRTGDVALLEAIFHLYGNHFERARAELRPVLDGELLCAAATNLVTAWLVEAELARRRNHDARAHNALAEALRLAEPETVLRPFHDMAAASRELLSASHGRFGARDDFAGRVWSSLPRASNKTTEKLTRRELDLLAELPTWRTAEEIAADLCVSVNTVKTHLRGIYRKLGVSTRRDAVTAAHTLGLL
ncbi:LuxR family transcriptional regulator [Rhodococcus sp. ABRD24]|nr:LuxR family transcriptional regulator [Rhodococcus sp. ABRD24]